MERLYYTDPYMKEFTATVTVCRQGKRGYEIALSRSCFYPEGGGQPGDVGFLNDVAVFDTHERDGEVWHYTQEPLEAGTAVTGRIDWDRRFDFMQQHSGEHMVSGVIHRRFGMDNVGFHMGAEMVTIDFSGILTEQQLLEVEEEVNRRIWQDDEIKCWYPDAGTLKEIPYRSKKELSGDVRIVEIPGADICACCGTHVKRTGEIGLVKLLTVQKFHSGVRVEMISGLRAYQYLTAVQQQNRRVSQLLSAKVMETADAVEAMAKDVEEKRIRIFQMENQRFYGLAEQYRDAGDVVLREEDLSADGVRRLAIALQDTCGGRAAVFSGDDKAGYKYAVGHPGGDLRAWVKELNAALGGRGGGKPGFVQGSLTAKWEEIVAFMQK